MDDFFDVCPVPESFSALVIRVVFDEARALRMAFALVVEPLFGDSEFRDDLFRGDIVIRFRSLERCCWHGPEKHSRS